MSYTRVIPRDLFNEASLLKCLGRLSLRLLDYPIEGVSLELDHPASGFNIIQDPNDGSIFVSNLWLVKSGKFLLFRPLNDRSKWPLYVTLLEDDLRVFNEDGSLSEEFLEWTHE
jgi:hypothetical protein